MSNNYSYNSLCRHKLSGQSYTSPILRRTGNSPIWGKITVPIRGSSMYDSPTQPTVRLESPTKFTTGESVNHPKDMYRHNVRSQENDRPHGRPLYTPQTSRNVFQNTQETITSQYSQTHTCNQPESSRFFDAYRHVVHVNEFLASVTGRTLEYKLNRTGARTEP